MSKGKKPVWVAPDTHGALKEIAGETGGSIGDAVDMLLVTSSEQAVAGMESAALKQLAKDAEAIDGVMGLTDDELKAVYHVLTRATSNTDMAVVMRRTEAWTALNKISAEHKRRTADRRTAHGS